MFQRHKILIACSVFMLALSACSRQTERANSGAIPGKVAPITSLNFVKYPNEINKKFSFSEKPLAVYEGEVPIKVLLKAAAATTRSSHSLPAKLNVQACDDQVCYSPGTLELTIPVVVK